MRLRTLPLVVGLLTLAFALGAYAGLAGAPDPPGPPAATSSHSLEDLYNRLDTGAPGSQSTFTEPGSGPGTGTGHTLNEVMAKAPVLDESQGAVASDVAQGKTFWGLTAGGWGPLTGTATRADPACFDDTNRYVDCGNGTVTDTVTGLIWLKKANCYTTLFSSYAVANERAAVLEDGQCGLTDHSSPGDWRLPTADEWTATVARARELNCLNPALTNTAGTGCFADGPEPFTGVLSGDLIYWTRSSSTTFPDSAGYLQLGPGLIWAAPKKSYHHIWPVRDGQ